MTLTLKRMSTKAPGADLRVENLNSKGARDYYEETLTTSTKIKVKE